MVIQTENYGHLGLPVSYSLYDIEDLYMPMVPNWLLWDPYSESGDTTLPEKHFN